MKKLLLSTITLFVTTIALSQTEQGKISVGASSDLSFSFLNGKQEFRGQENDLDERTSFAIAPTAGYFVIDNLQVGLVLALSTEKVEGERQNFNNFGPQTNSFESKLSTFAVGPFVRYYFLENSIKPFVQASVAYVSTKNESDDEFSSFESKSNGIGFGFDAGVAFFLNNFISLDLGVGYSRSIITPNNGDEGEDDFKTKLNAIRANVGFNLFF